MAEKKRKWMCKILQIIWKIRDGILKMSEDLQGREAGDDTGGEKTKLAENEKRKSKLSSHTPAHFKSHSLQDLKPHVLCKPH